MTIKTLVLAGGAYKGLMLLGALNYLNSIKYYNVEDITDIYGTSVGSLIGVIICLKLDWQDIVDYTINKPWHNTIKSPSELILNIINKKGMLDRTFFDSVFLTLFKNSGLNINSTLGDLFTFSNICLNLFTVNLTTFKLERFNYKTHPDLNIIEAVYMSCCLPVVFQPIKYKGNYYIDGGLKNPYPLNVCLEDFDNEDEILSMDIINEDFSPLDENTSLFSFGYYLFYRLMKESYNYKVNKKIKNEIILPAQHLNISDAQLLIKSSDKRKEYIKKGETYVKLFLKYKL